MKYTSIIRPEAEADLEQARAWYDRQRPGLGAVLHRDVRRAVVRRFPDGIFFLSPSTAYVGLLEEKRSIYQRIEHVSLLHIVSVGPVAAANARRRRWGKGA